MPSKWVKYNAVLLREDVFAWLTSEYKVQPDDPPLTIDDWSGCSECADDDLVSAWTRETTDWNKERVTLCQDCKEIRQEDEDNDIEAG